MLDNGNYMLDKRLLGTRDNLLQVCDELGVTRGVQPRNVWQCINCSIWAKTVEIDEDGSTFCMFCADDNNFKI